MRFRKEARSTSVLLPDGNGDLGRCNILALYELGRDCANGSRMDIRSDDNGSQGMDDLVSFSLTANKAPAPNAGTNSRHNYAWADVE